MMSLAWTLPFLALGLLGAVHCAGMCGGFAIWVSGGAEAKRPSLQGPLLYVAGKAVTYAMMGILVSSLAASLKAGGAGGSELPGRVSNLSFLSTLCAWMAGGVLMLHGLACLFKGRVFRHPQLDALGAKISSLVRRTLAPALQGIRALPGYAGPLGVGLFTGLIPCGLSWSAVLLAASLPPPQAALGMFVFGFATSPALLGVAFGWNLLSARHRRVAAYAVGPLLLLFGALTVIRGGAFLQGTVAAQVLPDCCDTSDSPAAE